MSYIRAGFIANIAQQLFRLARHRRITAPVLKSTLLVRFRRLVEIEFRFLRYFTDVWNIHQQDDKMCIHYSSTG